MSKTKKKTDKSLPIGIKLLLILLLSCSIVGTGFMAFIYKYGTLVGMKENQVNDTPATLIFIPDDVLIFPDEVLNSQ